MSCILFPLTRPDFARTSDASSYTLRATINGVTENLPLTMTADRYYWLSGDGQADADGGVAGVGDAVIGLLASTLGAHSEAPTSNVSVTMSATNRITVTADDAMAFLWNNAATTLNALVFGWTQADTASATTQAAPNQTYGAWTPTKGDGAGWPPSTDTRDIAQRKSASAVALSGRSRTSYLGAANATRDLGWTLLPNHWALQEYGLATEATGTAEDVWENVSVGRPVRYYPLSSSRTSSSYTLYLGRGEELAEGRDASISVDRRIRYKFDLPLRSMTAATGTAGGALFAPAASSTAPGDPDGSVQYRVNSTTFGGLDSTLNQDGTHIRLLDGLPATPLTEGQGSALISTQLADGFPSIYGASVADIGAQYNMSDLFSSQVGYWLPDSGTTPGNWGMARATLSGTRSHPQPTNASLRESYNRWRVTTAGAAGNSAGERQNSTSTTSPLWIGDAAGRGGFQIDFLGVAFNAINSDSKMFIGFADSGAALFGAAAEPTTVTNMIGFGFNSTNANWQFMHNDAAGAATSVDLGASFAKGTANQIINFHIYVAANGSTVYYTARRTDSAAAAAGNVNTNIPANTVFGHVMMLLVNSPTAGTAVAASYECRCVRTKTPVAH